MANSLDDIRTIAIARCLKVAWIAASRQFSISVVKHSIVKQLIQSKWRHCERKRSNP
jgi:hypothetical protein